mmetsp:Transcript_12205/g.23476  ORF Transcript_12205/g.23476 Transcript_12205/m.23476 type:complete len:136 (-) Transcript_12205:331-738(-)|eukprot:CAMPEP_0170200892 /NCGR_PEP_ID=MMETSP0040_2-20121228/70103_1 /TAXON_ID=641309 /ORGANISM="Lotharella oceanica, Strain CCMP622" /LENGTH=135 /DNA_ID=CAMNT_0010451087 /DNA_START=222 /DNA_END=629 /DNA_ORIENTATION=+
MPQRQKKKNEDIADVLSRDLQEIKNRLAGILPNFKQSFNEAQKAESPEIQAVVKQGLTGKPMKPSERALKEVHKVRRSLAKLNAKMASWELEDQRGYSMASSNRERIPEIKSLRPPRITPGRVSSRSKRKLVGRK